MNLTKEQIGGAVTYYIETEYESQKVAANCLGVTQPDISRAMAGKIVHKYILEAMNLEQSVVYKSLPKTEPAGEERELNLLGNTVDGGEDD